MRAVLLAHAALGAILVAAMLAAEGYYSQRLCLLIGGTVVLMLGSMLFGWSCANLIRDTDDARRTLTYERGR